LWFWKVIGVEEEGGQLRCEREISGHSITPFE